MIEAEYDILNSVANDVIGLTIMPTEKCNFRCVYCYEDFQLGKMNNAVVNKIKMFLGSRVPELRRLDINWFGGEPLLAKDIIFDIHEFVNSIKPPGLVVNGGITTNGYNLSKNTFNRLVDSGVTTFSISLDGIEGIHDTSRRHINKTIKTFERIYRNLIMIKDSEREVIVILRIHHTPLSFGSIQSFIATINNDLFSDSRFLPLIEPIKDLGGVKSAHVYSSYQEMKRSNDMISSMLSVKSLTNDKYICYAAKPNNFIIRSDGSLARCTVALSKSSNSIGYFNDDGSVFIDQEKSHLWTNQITKGYTEFNKCPNRFVPGDNESELRPIKFMRQNNLTEL